MKRVSSAVMGVAVLAVLGTAAALSPASKQAGDELFEIPKGTFARRMAGEKLEILPDRIHLIAGSTLVLRNSDEVPQIFGPTLIMPGQVLRVPFETPAEYQFICSAHINGEMTIVVDEAASFVPSRVRSWAKRVVSSVLPN